jgi:N-methylhydantoinase A
MVGIDVGGTFTDFSVFEETTGAVLALKVPSTPPNFAEGIRRGLERLAGEYRIDLGEIAALVHGTTIAVNTVIQRNGARLGLLVTEGFRDILDIQRLRLPNPFDLRSRRPTPLIGRAQVAEVRERLRANGSVDVPLNENQVVGATNSLLARGGIEGLVLALLHAYRNPEHERRAAAVIATSAPGLPVNLSSEVWPEAREYERTALAVLDAYVQPKVRRYLAGFLDVLRATGVTASPYVTKSNGGIMPVEAAQERTVATLLSGPASGVIGAAYVASQAGFDRCITLDVGGTSADIAIIEDGQPQYSSSEHVGDFPVIMPVIGVSSIGAGGGSVAWVDAMGVPKVGPQSNGASPGPACYGLGGLDATLTDAFLVCGFLNPEQPLGGQIALDPRLGRQAVGRFAAALGTGITEAAESIVRVAVATMYAEFTKVLSRNAVDPREYALVAFGGAGPLVAALIAREIGIPLVFVPPSPGTLCALGAISADVVNDAVRTVQRRISETLSAELSPQYHSLEEELRGWLQEYRLAPAEVTFKHSADMRYVGQAYEVRVDVDPAWLHGDFQTPLAERFHETHARFYGHADLKAAVEIMNLRVQMRGSVQKVQLAEVRESRGNPVARETRSIILDGRSTAAPIYSRSELGRGDRIPGPAVVEQTDTTTLIPPGFAGHVDRWGNLLLRMEG